MNDSENLHRLESDLEDEKRDLRKDIESITGKARETRAALSPTSLVRERIFLLSGLALALGLALGFRGFAIEDVGKPVARTVLSSIGKQSRKARGRRNFWVRHENGQQQSSGIGRSHSELATAALEDYG
jgi:hypothetical protein